MNTVILYLVPIFFLKISEVKAVEFEIVEAVIHHTAELPCNVTAEAGDDRLNILAWYKDDSSTAFYSSRDLRADGGGFSQSEGRYQLVDSDDGSATLQIDSVQPSDAGDYHCLADFVSSPTQKTFSTLRVIEPPQRLWVVHENGSRVSTATTGSNVSENIGPYYVGDTVHLFCVAFGGKPLATLTWLVDGRPTKNSSTPLSDQRVRSDLVHGPLRREHRGLVLTCSANNNDVTQPIYIDVVIDMVLGPELVSVRDVTGGEGRGVAGQALRLQCRALGAHPPPPLLWRLNDHTLHVEHNNLTMEPSQQLVTSEVLLPLSAALDEALVTCCAPAHVRAQTQYVCAQPLPLAVTYKPNVTISAEGGSVLEENKLAVVKGSNVSLTCIYAANPPVDAQTWFHEDYAIDEEDEEQRLHPTLELVNVAEKDAGEYSCWANNKEGFADSEPIVIDVTYPAYCEEEEIDEYGVSDTEVLNLTCKVKGNPAPSEYRWLIADGDDVHENVVITTENTLQYRRPNGTVLSTISCSGENGVTGTSAEALGGTGHCTFRVTDETAPRPPTHCVAHKTSLGEITVTCNKGHDGGLPQKFKFIVMSLEPAEELVGIVNLEPKFIIEEPKAENYKFVITATNEKGDSAAVKIYKENIVDESTGEEESVVAVANITTLSLSLCGGVLVVALLACGLVLCAHERAARVPRESRDAPLCAYNTDESNCETCHDSDEGSEFNVRRTESFRKAISRYPSKNFDVRRTNSFHSARYMQDVPEPESINKCTDMLRHTCRVHSMHNLHRRREMDAMCDHLVMQIPREHNYQVPKPMNTFYTLPRKVKNKTKHISDEASVITQNSDGFSLPPPPDEFGTYRAATRIRDIPTKSTPTYTTIKRKSDRDPKHDDVIISPMNTVGLPTISGTHNSIYSYPDDDNHHVKNNPFDDLP